MQAPWRYLRPGLRIPKQMKTYELTYIISSEITAEEAEAKASQISADIQGKEGVIIGQSNPTAKTLAYPIKKRASGFVGILEFQLEPEALTEIQEKLSKDEKIIRYMLVVKEPLKPRKEKRVRRKAVPEQESIVQQNNSKDEQEKQDKKEEKPKVELKDIEEQLEEILG